MNTDLWSQGIQDKMKELAKRYHLNVVCLPDGRLGEISMLNGYHGSDIIPLFLMARFAECELEKESLQKELENYKCAQSVQEEEKCQVASQQE